MNNKFDELTKTMAQSVTRRAALKKFGVGLAGIALACFGLESKAEASACVPVGSVCHFDQQCCSGICANGKCACAPSGHNCFNNADCCSGICKKTNVFGHHCG